VTLGNNWENDIQPDDIAKERSYGKYMDQNVKKGCGE
jgi:hypothetical protein